jgi:hypothetical protein
MFVDYVDTCKCRYKVQIYFISGALAEKIDWIDDMIIITIVLEDIKNL